MLALQGHRVYTAANRAVALEKFRQRAHDVILSDLRMSELGGTIVGNLAIGAAFDAGARLGFQSFP
jgi:CheY-like chemotaxis protein